MDALDIAQVCHEANRAYCETLEDGSQLPWEEAPDWQKESLLNGIAFHRQNPDAGDAASHENWLAEKKREGWKYGSIKEVERKLHPCMLPFLDLPPEQQAKDRLFRAIVHALEG